MGGGGRREVEEGRGEGDGGERREGKEGGRLRSGDYWCLPEINWRLLRLLEVTVDY